MTSSITLTQTSLLGVAAPGVNPASEQVTSVGSYTTPSDATYYIAAQNIGFYATGLRPNTVIYPYFDKKTVSAYCRPASFDSTLTAPTNNDFYSSGALGSTLTTDGNGNVAGIFYLPAQTFYSGDREFILSDQASITSVPSSATESTVYFKAYNYSKSNNSAIVSPRPSPTTTDSSTARATNQNSNFDPMCQSFFISSDMTSGAEGVFVTSVDLFFQSVSTTQGLTLDIRTMENGVPTTTVLPFSRKHTPASSMVASSNGLSPTTINFESPVFLRAGFNYALSIIPDGQTPAYNIWTTVVGHRDINTNNAVAQNWGEGVLFTSSTGTIWTPIQNQYLKFTLYQADFNTTPSTVSLTNADLEFLTLANISGPFTMGETVFQASANLTGTIAVSNTSYSVVGTGTTFTTSLVAGQKVVLQSGNSYSVATVSSIASNTAMTLKGVPSFTNAVATFMTPTLGRCLQYVPSLLELTLNNSNANTLSHFTANASLTGTLSGATATITAITDKIVSRFQPLLYTTSVQDTSISYSANVVTSGYTTAPSLTFSPSSMNYFSNNEIVVASKTNEILNLNGNKSLVTNLAFNTGDINSSPTLDTQSASLLGYKNLINNNDYSENTRYGFAVSKSVSNIITLAPGLASEDMTIFIDAYKPAGTNIELYGKFLSPNDPDAFSAKDWTRLNQITDASVVSDPSNRNDIKEFQYGLSSLPANILINGSVAVTNGSNVLTGVGTTFTSQLLPTSVIIIFSDASLVSYQVFAIQSINSDTSITLAAASTLTTTIGLIGSVAYPKSAFKNYQNQGIIRYYNSALTPFDTYTQFAIKAVFLAQHSYLVPRMLDYRVIATSV